MKPTTLLAICALSLQVSASGRGDHPRVPGFEPPAGMETPEAPNIPEAGALVLGLVGAMMLLRRRR